MFFVSGIFFVSGVFFGFRRDFSRSGKKTFFSHRKKFFSTSKTNSSHAKKYFSSIFHVSGIFPASKRYFSSCLKILLYFRFGAECDKQAAGKNFRATNFSRLGAKTAKKKNKKQTVSTRWVVSKQKKTKTQANKQTSERATTKEQGSKETRQSKQKVK